MSERIPANANESPYQDAQDRLDQRIMHLVNDCTIPPKLRDNPDGIAKLLGQEINRGVGHNPKLDTSDHLVFELMGINFPEFLSVDRKTWRISYGT